MTDHRTSRIYQKALAELRSRHPEEFEEIRQQLLSRAGIELFVTYDPNGRRNACLIYLADWLDLHESGPQSFHALGKAIGVSWNQARLYCKELESNGWITRDHGAKRSAATIKLTMKAKIVMERRTA
jgi:hypothetical protein